MKMINGRIVPPCDPGLIKLARAYLDRVQTQGVNEARGLDRAAGLLESIERGDYLVVPADVAAEPAAEGGARTGFPRAPAVPPEPVPRSRRRQTATS